MDKCKKTYGFFDFIERFFSKNKIEKKEKYSRKKGLVFEQEKKEEEYKILDEIREVKENLKCATSEFNLQTETELIESSVFLIRALEKKLNFLLKEARQKNIKYDEEIVVLAE